MCFWHAEISSWQMEIVRGTLACVLDQFQIYAGGAQYVYRWVGLSRANVACTGLGHNLPSW